MYHASPHLTYLLQTDLLKPDDVKTKLIRYILLGIGLKNPSDVAATPQTPC